VKDQLITLPAAVEDVRTILRAYIPIKPWIEELRRLAAQSGSLLPLVDQHKEFAQEHARLRASADVNAKKMRELEGLRDELLKFAEMHKSNKV
jgi:hypothetical protein